MPIFDQGYQHWDGHLAGRAWRWWTITRYGVRAQLKNRWVRIVTLFAFVPALALALALSLWGLVEQQSDLVMPLVRLINLPPELANGPKDFRISVWTLCYLFFFQTELFVSMILIVLVGPNLISQDLRFNAIPLYLSRPLRRFDYFAGKLGVIGVYLAAVVIAPAVLAYVLGLLFSLDLTVVKDTYHLLFGGIAFGVIIVLSAGTLMLALSSLSRNSRYVGVFWVGLWIVSNAVAGILDEVQNRETNAQMRKLQRQPFATGRFDPHRADATRQELEQELERIFHERIEAQRGNWRPLFSYTGNLQRLGNQLLSTEDAWVKLGNIFDPMRLASKGRMRGPSMAEIAAAQHPWHWSAGVLLGLFGISIWILTSRVKSLDRLK